MAEIVPGINRDALFADETSDYRIPAEPDPGQLVTLRFRTEKDNVDQVVCNTGINDYSMIKVESDELFDYYQCNITVETDLILLFFTVIKGEEVCYYNKLGVVEKDRLEDLFSFRITPGFHTPEWAKGAVMYQIFVDRFSRGDCFNDVDTGEYIYIGRPVSRVSDWNEYPAAMDVDRFYGGDLQGVWDKLDYIQYLGVEVIYFNPIFVSPSNHKYDCQDYDYIDPHLGVIVKDGGRRLGDGDHDNTNATRYMIRSTDKKNLEASNAYFARLVSEIHRRGMKVIIDGVFNHCGSFNKWLDREQIYEQSGKYEKGAYISEDSPYRSFFKFFKEDWPYNKNYDGWWGHDTLPKLNYEESAKLYSYVLNIAKKWVSPPYNVDGWRLDVAADLGHSSKFNHKFWRDFRKAVKEANPNALILAEHYGDPSSWLEGDQWDTIMNYDAFMEPVSWFLTGMEKHSDDYNAYLDGNGEHFFSSMAYHMSRMQYSSIITSMNELSNHDHSRFLTRTNKIVGRVATAGPEKASQGINYGIFRAGVVMQMTWPGAPTVYYGDETGVCGWTDPDNRRTYPWGQEDVELIEFYSYMIHLHKAEKSLRFGSVKPLLAGANLIAYGRMREDECCVIVVNNNKDFQDVQVPVWQLGIWDSHIMTRRMLTSQYGYNAGEIKFYSKNGYLDLELEGHSTILLTCRLGEKRAEETTEEKEVLEA